MSDQPGVPQLPPADPTNPFLAPVPAHLTTGLAKGPDGREQAVLTIRHAAGGCTVFLDRDTITTWGQVLIATGKQMSGLIIPNGVVPPPMLRGQG